MNPPAVICLTPVRNEAWILERFLQAASQWADLIIVADQRSDDGSREIAESFAKARILENESAEYDEASRQRMLIEAARSVSVPGRRFLIALDADEFLTPGAWATEEWSTALASPPGTIVRFPWLNIGPDFHEYWSSAGPMPFGFMDDGSEHSGEWIHSPRVPARPESPSLQLQDVAVLHLQYTNWGRMESKHRWYQCMERVKSPKRSAIEIYRKYHHMDAVPAEARQAVPASWVVDYRAMGVDIDAATGAEAYPFDREVLRYFERYGVRTFVKEAVWDVDWTSLAAQFGLPKPERFSDPRSTVERKLHSWLEWTQSRSKEPLVRWQERFARRLLGW